MLTLNKFVKKAIIAVFLILFTLGCSLFYLHRSALNERQELLKAWGQVEVHYQRKADLLPRFVKALHGFERIPVANALQQQMSLSFEKVYRRNVMGDEANYYIYHQNQEKLDSMLRNANYLAGKYEAVRSSKEFSNLQVIAQNIDRDLKMAIVDYDARVLAFNNKVSKWVYKLLKVKPLLVF